MKISEIQALEPLTCVQDQFEDEDVSTGYTSDLLSDVMGNAEEGSVLITIQAHKNTVAVSSLAGITAIIICNKRPVPDDMLAAAKDEGIAVFETAENQFQTSARIAQQINHSPA